MSTQTTTHPVTPEELMALLDGELSADRARSVSVHTESCAACQQAFAATLNTTRSLTAWTVGEAPSRTENSIHASAKRIASELRNRGLRSVVSARPRWVVGLVACAGVLLLIALSASILTRPATDQWIPVPGGAAKAVSVYSAAERNGIAKAHSVDDATVNFDAPVAQPGLTAPMGSPATPKTKTVMAISEFDKIQAYSRLQRPNDTPPTGPMIARTVSLAIFIKDFDASRKSLDAILVRYNGYAANLSVSTPQGSGRSLQASLRIPASQLAPALAELKSLGHVENENQNGEEVTQQHADLLARLKNSRETEQRLQAILTQRTGKISDVLEVEQEIARVRGEIEEMEAEQKNLEHRVDFATVDLKLAEEYKAKLESTAPSFSTEFHNALVNGYRNVTDTIVALVLFFAEYGPILLFWALVLLVPAWLVWRRWRQVASPAM